MLTIFNITIILFTTISCSSSSTWHRLIIIAWWTTPLYWFQHHLITSGIKRTISDAQASVATKMTMMKSCLIRAGRTREADLVVWAIREKVVPTAVVAEAEVRSIDEIGPLSQPSSCTNLKGRLKNRTIQMFTAVKNWPWKWIYPKCEFR